MVCFSYVLGLAQSYLAIMVTCLDAVEIGTVILCIGLHSNTLLSVIFTLCPIITSFMLPHGAFHFKKQWDNMYNRDNTLDKRETKHPFFKIGT